MSEVMLTRARVFVETKGNDKVDKVIFSLTFDDGSNEEYNLSEKGMLSMELINDLYGTFIMENSYSAEECREILALKEENARLKETLKKAGVYADQLKDDVRGLASTLHVIGQLNHVLKDYVPPAIPSYYDDEDEYEDD